MIKAIAIDDEPPALKLIELFCSNSELITLDKSFTKPHEALKYLKKFPVDLLFLDINMPSLSGIDLYKSVEQELMVIFTTAHLEYAVEGFNLNAVDYLLKPYTQERFNTAIQKANEFYKYTHQLSENKSQYLYVRADYSLNKINIADILLIEGLDDYLKIYIINNTKPIVARMTMKSVLDKLPPTDFIRVHRSFIVPFAKIESVRNKVITTNGREIPIGSSFEEQFFKLFKG